MVVACARGIDGAPDDIAHRLVPAPLSRGLRSVLKIGSFGLVEHISWRTVTIDAVIRRRPAPQLVILGAGLDTRAHRLDELADTVVFEVDHPSTSSYKQRRAAALPLRARALHRVTVDFERDDLALRLAECGHDETRPTMWIWEGVTMYLTPEAVGGTLGAVAGRSAASSTLVLSYVTPDLVKRARRVLAPLSRPAFGVLGEPLRYSPTPEEIANAVSAHGFVVERDEAGPGLIAERVLVAVR
jgi:methyltransferase (TIGR00027 family)